MKSIRTNILMLALCLCAPAWAAPILLDRIVAVVDNGVITQHELDQAVQRTLRQLALQKTPAPPRHLLQRQLLERMITERILLKLADDTNIRIDGAQLDRALARIAQQNGLALDEFRRALEREGVDFNAFREQIRNEMIIARLREREVDSKVVVTDAEIDLFLANTAPQSDQQTEYQLAHILVLTPEGANPEQVERLRARAQQALAELRAGADFAQVAAAYSDARDALQGGVLGWRSEAQLPSLFLDALRDLSVGGVSPVLRSGNGFHILKLIDKRGKDIPTIIRQTRARHILIKVSEIVADADARNRLRLLRERIVNGADFAELARLHSDDLSAAKGGELGWLSPGDTVPEFERAMDALAIGEVSQPVRSPFGWHLIQVLERRDQDVTQERRRLEARAAIRARKAEEAFDDWVRQMRDRAYVEYRLEE
ncbi:MAG: peptidylprolyl isomerase [Thiobacillaceae bacterium]|nr:peptidylprolyl isomerase [Thiobacillaceae bacterium]MCX7673880.1 peptidylprolyl isomerase [Thiobacillaceae bacterium]MDW8322911.1 peptidylprolyl isomerase [Burkholderiales bacterium]